jgi:hypothetical protein
VVITKKGGSSSVSLSLWYWLLLLLRHPATFFSTCSTCLSTLPTMVHLRMFFTLLSTCIAYVSTYTTNLLYMFTVHWHNLWCSVAYASTFPIQLDTSLKHLYILLSKTGCSTELTWFCTAVASIYTALIFLVLKSLWTCHLVDIYGYYRLLYVNFTGVKYNNINHNKIRYCKSIKR